MAFLSDHSGPNIFLESMCKIASLFSFFFFILLSPAYILFTIQSLEDA